MTFACGGGLQRKYLHLQLFDFLEHVEAGGVDVVFYYLDPTPSEKDAGEEWAAREVRRSCAEPKPGGGAGGAENPKCGGYDALATQALLAGVYEGGDLLTIICEIAWGGSA